MKIKNLMSEDVITIDKDQNLNDGLKLLRKNNISCLPVVNTVDGKKELVGIVSEKDIAAKLGSLKAGSLPPSRFHISSVMIKDVVAVSEDMSLDDVAKIMLDKGIGSVPIESNGIMVGIVSKADFTTLATGRIYQKLFVEDYMTNEPTCVSPSDRLVHARRLMADECIGRLPVIDNDGLIGMLTSKDLMRAFITFRKNVPEKYQSAQIKNLFVEDTMSHNVLAVTKDMSIDEVANIMIDTGYNGLPVVENDYVIGIITQTDILALIADLESE